MNMTILERRRDRLVHVLDLARMYRGWTKQEIAQALGREPSKVVPESGNPKLDLVVGLARLLEWSIGEVAECLWGEPASDDAAEGETPPLARPAPDREAGSAGGRRAVALWCSAHRCRDQGRYQHAVERLQELLLERSLSAAARAAVQANLAEAHCTLWHLAEARALASELLRHSAHGRPGVRATEPCPGAAPALALSVRGHAHRRLLRTQPGSLHRHASAARADLVASLTAIDALLAARGAPNEGSAPRSSADLDARSASDPDVRSTSDLDSMLEPSPEALLAVANTAKAGIVECDVELGALPPDEGVSQLLRGLDHAVDPEAMEPGAMLSSWGWWSVFGANLALAHFSGDTQQRFLAIFTNKALEIAERTGDWALRERAFMLEHLRRRGSDPLVLDHDDVRSIIGAMGRFPQFRDAGWALLRDAVVLE